MFPRASLHVAICTLSLQFLPEILNSVLDKSSFAYNKGHTSCHDASPVVAEAFAETSRKGLRKFFEYRAEELAPGGVPALLCTTRRGRGLPEVQLPDDTMDFIPVWVPWKRRGSSSLMKSIFIPVVLVAYESYGAIIYKLVPIVASPTLPHLRVVPTDPEIAARVQLQGVVAEELLNIPQCSPSVDEIQEAIEHPISAFHIQKLESIDTFRTFPNDAEDTMFKDAQSFANLFTNESKSSGTGSMLNAHLGPEFTEMPLERTRQNLENAVHGYSHQNVIIPLA